MAINTQRVWYVDNSRVNINWSSASTVVSGQPDRYTINTQITKLSAPVWTIQGTTTIGNVTSSVWANVGDVVSAHSIDIAKAEQSSTTAPTPVTGSAQQPNTQTEKAVDAVAAAFAAGASGSVGATVVYNDAQNKLSVVVSGARTVNNVTANYTIAASDTPAVMLNVTAASAVTITVPADATTLVPLETPIRWRQTGAGQVTFAGATGGATVTINSVGGNKKSSAQFATGELVRTAANTWVLSGSLTA